MVGNCFWERPVQEVRSEMPSFKVWLIAAFGFGNSLWVCGWLLVLPPEYHALMVTVLSEVAWFVNPVALLEKSAEKNFGRSMHSKGYQHLNSDGGSHYPSARYSRLCSLGSPFNSPIVVAWMSINKLPKAISGVLILTIYEFDRVMHILFR